MNRFNDYQASAITPKMTLLEKLNAIIKWLKENPTVPIFIASTNFTTSNLSKSVLENAQNYEITIGDLVLFEDGKMAEIISVGTDVFSVSENYVNLRGEQGIQGIPGEDGSILYLHRIVIKKIRFKDSQGNDIINDSPVQWFNVYIIKNTNTPIDLSTKRKVFDFLYDFWLQNNYGAYLDDNGETMYYGLSAITAASYNGFSCASVNGNIRIYFNEVSMDETTYESATDTVTRL